MKILQIAPPWIATPPNGYGGTELVIHNLCEQFIKLGHEVTLFATKNSKTSAKLKYVFDEGLYEQGLPWNGALPPIIHYQQAFKLFREGNYDIAHVHLSSQTDLMLLAFLSEIKKPYVLTVHGHLPFDRYTNFDNFYFGFYAQKLSAVSISKTMKSFLPKQFRSDGYIYNPINVTNMTFNDKPEDYYTWIGRIVPDKGLHHAINIARKTGIKFIFAGSVDPHNANGAADYFKSKIEPHIDGKQIQFVGEVNFAQKNKLFSNAKAFLNPIEWIEPFGMVIVESMACGTPVISFAKGAANELIKDGETGFLVSNEEAMIEAMQQIKTINRAACREHVLQNFSDRSSAARYLSLYYKKVREHYRQKAALPFATKNIISTKNMITGLIKSPGISNLKPM